MQNILNNVKSSGLKVAEYFTPVLKESKFQETGVLTPEEFVAAGDHLVHHCPTWQWASGDDSYVKDYLPKDKQFLITRNVPCYKRCYQMEYTPDLEKVLDEEEGGWVDTHHYTDDKDELNTRVSEMNLDDDGKSAPASAVVGSCDADDDNQEAVDMEDFIESGMIDSESPLTEARKSLPAGCAGGGEIENVRTYDLNITYDKYYQTPRLWLFGYNESKQALSVEEMYEDFSADHANKTITMETHPHLPGPPQASVHPCRHAQVMKKLIDQITEGGGELGVHMYLIVFLKFVQAIIPTVEYDFTQNIAL